MAANHQELLDAIGSMSVLELSEFVDEFKEKFNVTALAAPVMAAAGGAAVEAEAEKDEFDVILQAIGDKKIQVIKAVREITSLGLKEAKELVDGAPSTVRDAVQKAEAEQIKAKLEEQGATVVLK